MNGKHRAPRTYTHIEKIRIMNDVIVFMFGCMTLVCEIRVGSFLFFEMNVLLLLLGTAEICLACFMYYQEFIRNRYASAVPDYGEDNVRAAGQAGTHSVQHPVIESGRTREQSDRNVEH